MKKELNTVAICMAAIGFLSSVFPQSKVLAQACPGLGSITLTVVAAPVPTLTAPPQLCSSANGTVAVNQTFSTYVWNTGGTGQSIAITNPGTFQVCTLPGAPPGSLVVQATKVLDAWCVCE